ncbi:hypothetical protein Pfo_013114 [Paulownia fortunei]|nr:hypothetical protein Pfo_013114 [Paulownia fortunei]
MVSDEQVTGDRWIRRRWKGIGGRRRWGGSELAATPFLEWKLRGGDSAGGSRGHLLGAGGGAVAAVSARKLAASLWQLAATTNGSGSVRWQCGLLFDRLGFEFCSSMPIPKFATEGVTKWDYCNSRAWDDVSYFRSHVKLTSVASARQAELLKARKQVNELEAERGWSRTKIKYCMKKLNEERASWMRTEHQKMCSIVKNLEDGVKRERKNCRRMDIVNSKLLRDIAEAKLLARKLMHNLEKEKKARELLEDVCNELAKEIEGYKAEIGALRNQRKRIQEEVEKERKMLQIAEVWREEQAQMKLVDAKLILENKYAEMNNFIADLKAFLRKSNLTTDVNVMWEAKVLRQAFDPFNIQGIKEVSCMLPGNMFTIIKDSQSNEAEGRNADHCFSHDQAYYASIVHNINPEVNDATRKSVCSNGLTGGIETVTQAEIYSSPTLGESEGSVNKISSSKYMSNCDTKRNKNEHHGSQKSESSEISLVSLKQSKKKSSSACKLQRTLPRNKDTCKTILIDGGGRLSTRSISSIVSLASPQRVLNEGAVNVGGNPHVVRAMKGHIEWPEGIRRHGLAANLMEAKLESQKALLRNVLKQRS